MKYYVLALVIVHLNSCFVSPVQTINVSAYEDRETCEKQKDILNKYHNTQHFLCVMEDK